MRRDRPRVGIRKKVILSLLAPIFSLVILAALAVAYTSQRSENALLERRIDALAEGSAVMFEDLVWQLDYATLQLLLDEFVMLGAATGARVDIAQQSTLTSGIFTGDATAYARNVTLVHRRADRETTLGTLTLEMNRAGVSQVVKARVLTTVVIATLAVFLTILIIQSLLDRRLVIPVVKIASELDNWSGDWGAFKIDLDRTTRRGTPPSDDEIDRLVASIHAMRDQILLADKVIRSHEDRLLIAAQIAGIGYSSFDLKTGVYLQCDANFAAMFGMTEEELIGRAFHDEVVPNLVQASDLASAKSLRATLAASGRADGIFNIVTPSGEARFIRQIFELKAGENGGDDEGVVRSVAQDVTELTTLQANLLQEQKLKSIGSLTGGVAHDFNNILAIISGNLELLRESVTAPLPREFVDLSLSAVQRGAGLTSQLLSFARKQPLRPEVINAARLFQDSRALLRTTVGETIDLEFILDGGLWQVEADKVQLETAVLNLVINARDAMPSGGKLTIEVGNARLDRIYANSHDEVVAGQYVCIAISDTGQGMSKPAVARALEPFYTTKGVGKGTGLGLPMAYGFTKQSGGHLKIYSEEGSGTTVKIYLPRVLETGQPAPVEAEKPNLTGYAGQTVFLIEDNEDLRTTFRAQLKRLGFTVITASDGPTAIAQTSDVKKVDFILCDVILPNGMNGIEVVAELRKKFGAVPVVYMSGYTENAIIHHGRLDDGVTLLQKPFTISELKIAFDKAFDAQG